MVKKTTGRLKLKTVEALEKIFPVYHYALDECDPISMRINTFMRAGEWTDLGLSRESGVSTSTIKNIREGHTRSPRYSSAARLMEAMGYGEEPIVKRINQHLKHVPRVRIKTATKKRR